jgi:hypothetical protein
MNAWSSLLPQRMVLAGLILVLIWTIGAAWVFEIWAMLAAQAAIFALTALAACVWLYRGVWPVSKWLSAPLAAAGIWGLVQLQTCATVEGFVTVLAVIRIGSLLGVLMLGLFAFADHRNARIFRGALILLGTLLASLALAQLLTANGEIFWIVRSRHTHLPMGPFLSGDSYAAFIELLLPVALWRATQPPRGWTFALCSAIMYTSVIASLSRAGSILVSLEVLALLLSTLLVGQATQRRETMCRAVAAAFLIIVLASAFGWQELLKRFDSGDLWQIRREYFLSSVAMLRSRPLMGFGLGTWPIVYPRYAVIDLTAASPHAHNDWMEWASDGGVPFLTVMLIPIVRAAIQALRRPWGMGIIAVSLHAVFDFPFQIYSILLLFCLMSAALEVTPAAICVRKRPTSDLAAVCQAS